MPDTLRRKPEEKPFSLEQAQDDAQRGFLDSFADNETFNAMSPGQQAGFREFYMRQKHPDMPQPNYTPPPGAPVMEKKGKPQPVDPGEHGSIVQGDQPGIFERVREKLGGPVFKFDPPDWMGKQSTPRQDKQDADRAQAAIDREAIARGEKPSRRTRKDADPTTVPGSVWEATKAVPHTMTQMPGSSLRGVQAPVDLATGHGERPWEEGGLYQVGDEFRQFAEKAFPMDEDYQDKFIVQMGHALGSMGFFVGLGALGRAVGGPVGQWGAAGVMASTAGIEEAMTHVRDYNEQNPDAPLSETEAKKIASKWGSAAGLLQIANLGQYLKAVPKHLQGSFAKYFVQRALKTAGNEFLVETGGAVVQDIARATYDKDHPIFSQIRTHMQERGLVAGAASLLLQAIMLPGMRKATNMRAANIRSKVWSGEQVTESDQQFAHEVGFDIAQEQATADYFRQEIELMNQLFAETGTDAPIQPAPEAPTSDPIVDAVVSPETAPAWSDAQATVDAVVGDTTADVAPETGDDVTRLAEIDRRIGNLEAQGKGMSPKSRQKLEQLRAEREEIARPMETPIETPMEQADIQRTPPVRTDVDQTLQAMERVRQSEAVSGAIAAIEQQGGDAEAFQQMFLEAVATGDAQRAVGVAEQAGFDVETSEALVMDAMAIADQESRGERVPPERGSGELSQPVTPTHESLNAEGYTANPIGVKGNIRYEKTQDDGSVRRVTMRANGEVALDKTSKQFEGLHPEGGVFAEDGAVRLEIVRDNLNGGAISNVFLHSYDGTPRQDILGKIPKTWSDQEVLDHLQGRYFNIAPATQKAPGADQQSPVTPTVTPTVTPPVTPTHPAVGKYARSGSTTGRVVEVREDGKYVLEGGAVVTPKAAKNWTVQDEAFEAEAKKPEVVEQPQWQAGQTLEVGDDTWTIEGVEDGKVHVRKASSERVIEHIPAEHFEKIVDVARKNFESRKVQAEKDAAEKTQADAEKVERENIDGFKADATPMERGRVVKRLSEMRNYKGKPYSIRDLVRKLVEDGAEPNTFEEARVKPMTSKQHFRADGAQQEAHEKKMREAGNRTVYRVGTAEVGKIGHDYAAHLMGQKKPEAAAQPEAKTKEPWEMTKGEYVDGRYRSPGMHLYAVQQAISEGKPIPSEVLAEYPELAQKTEVGSETEQKAKAFAAELKRQGVSRRETWTRWNEETSRDPGMDADEWYQIYDKADGPTIAEKPKRTIPKKDVDLDNIEEISERLKSIERQRDELSSKSPVSSEARRKRDERISKFAERVERLEKRRAELRRAQKAKEAEAKKPESVPDKSIPHPWEDASVDDEMRWFGSKVEVLPSNERFKDGFTGTVARVLNKGELIGVKEDKSGVEFEIPTERVVILEVIDNNKGMTDKKGSATTTDAKLPTYVTDYIAQMESVTEESLAPLRGETDKYSERLAKLDEKVKNLEKQRERTKKYSQNYNKLSKQITTLRDEINELGGHSQTAGLDLHKKLLARKLLDPNSSPLDKLFAYSKLKTYEGQAGKDHVNDVVYPLVFKEVKSKLESMADNVRDSDVHEAMTQAAVEVLSDKGVQGFFDREVKIRVREQMVKEVGDKIRAFESLDHPIVPNKDNQKSFLDGLRWLSTKEEFDNALVKAEEANNHWTREVEKYEAKQAAIKEQAAKDSDEQTRNWIGSIVEDVKKQFAEAGDTFVLDSQNIKAVPYKGSATIFVRPNRKGSWARLSGLAGRTTMEANNILSELGVTDPHAYYRAYSQFNDRGIAKPSASQMELTASSENKWLRMSWNEKEAWGLNGNSFFVDPVTEYKITPSDKVMNEMPIDFGSKFEQIVTDSKLPLSSKPKLVVTPTEMTSVPVYVFEAKGNKQAVTGDKATLDYFYHKYGDDNITLSTNPTDIGSAPILVHHKTEHRVLGLTMPFIVSEESLVPGTMEQARERYKTEDAEIERLLESAMDKKTGRKPTVSPVEPVTEAKSPKPERTTESVLYFVNYTEQEGKGRTSETSSFSTLTEAREFAKGKHGWILRQGDKSHKGDFTTDKTENNFLEYFGDFEPSAQEGENIKRLTGQDAPAVVKKTTTTDPADVQRIQNSITEGETILKTGEFNGKKRTTEYLENVRESVINAKARIGDTSPTPIVKKAKSDPTPAPDGKLDDFGEKIGGARKDRTPSLEQTFTDNDIAGLPLSKIWPKAEVDAIEDTWLAAVATATRDSVPAKPKQSYKVKRWVESVKLVRELMRIAQDKGRDFLMNRLKNESKSLEHFATKIELLEKVDREHWGRIGKVENHPDAFRYKQAPTGSKNVWDTSGEKVPSPHSSIYIDGKYHQIPGGDIAVNADKVNEILGESGKLKDVQMKFEVRGGRGSYGVNKKGDPLYRKLKVFETSKEAFDFIKSNHNDLVAEWENVKERDNVKETDVRRDENRDRQGKDHRQGKDVTPEMFSDSFGFRGVEFGNWVSQGDDAKGRQGMLNQAYDALADLADILGVPSKAMSLNGTLGLAFGARGSGRASAHYEPSKLVINLTKTRGAGTLAHEFFHGLDHYFQRLRTTEGKTRNDMYITHAPENMYVNKTSGLRMSEKEYLGATENDTKDMRWSERGDWEKVGDVRPEVAQAFHDFVTALDKSPMSKRSSMMDKGKAGYWSRTLERAARAFEVYIIAKMQQGGYHNDYLANVVGIDEFQRNKDHYPYLLESELPPIEQAFDDLFSTIETKETDQGVAMFQRRLLPMERPVNPNKKLLALMQDKTLTEEQRNARMEEIHQEFDEYFTNFDQWAESLPDMAKFTGDNGVVAVAHKSNDSEATPWRVTLFREDGGHMAPDGHMYYRTKADAVKDAAQGREYTPDVSFQGAIPADPTTKPVPQLVLQQEVNKVINNTLTGLKGEVTVVQSEADLPADLRKAIDRSRKQGNVDAFRAVYWGGKIFVVADAYTTTEGLDKSIVTGTVTHEGRHWALDQAFDFNDKKRKAWFQQAGLTKAHREDVNAYMRDNNLTDRAYAAEEVLIDKIARGETGGWLDKLVEMVMQAIRKVAPNLKLTQAEIRQMFARADMLAEGGGQTRQGQGSFMDAMFQIAHHGTPHTFAPEKGFPHGRFRLDKMGTGEGAQAYGWGVYLAQAKETGLSYRDQLAHNRGNVTFNGESVDAMMLEINKRVFKGNPSIQDYALREIHQSNSVQGAIETLEGRANQPDWDAEQQKRFAGMLEWITENRDKFGPQGSLYKLDIPDAVMPKLLDWDGPLPDTAQMRKLWDKVYDEPFDPKSVDGARFYKDLADTRGVDSQEGASIELRRAGIPGHKFLDQLSRGKGEGTRNYVIWDQNVLDQIALLERNEQALDDIRHAEDADADTETVGNTEYTDAETGLIRTDNIMLDAESEAMFSRAQPTSPPVNWNEPDVQMGKAWSQDVVAKFLNVKSDKHIYDTMIDLGELTPVRAERESAKEVREGQGEIDEAYLREAEQILEDYTDEQANKNDPWHRNKFEEYRDELPWDWEDGYSEQDVQDLARELQARSEESGYSEDEYTRTSQGFPPIVVTRKKDGSFVINDGNHRVDIWQEQGYEQAPAWVNDEVSRSGGESLADTPRFQRAPAQTKPQAPAPKMEVRSDTLPAQTTKVVMAPDDKGVLAPNLIKGVIPDARRLFEAVTDRLVRSDSPMLQMTGEKLVAMYDATEARIGQWNGPIYKHTKKLSKAEMKQLSKDFEAYMRHSENGRKAEADAVLQNAHPELGPFIKTVQKLYHDTGVENQKVGMMVADGGMVRFGKGMVGRVQKNAQGQEVVVGYEGGKRKDYGLLEDISKEPGFKQGGWRLIGKIPEGKYWPRVMRQDVLRVLQDEKYREGKGAELWNEVVDALVTEGYIQDRADAMKYLGNYFSKESSNDYFAAIEKARGEPLPEIMYDYGMEVVNRYAYKWAHRISQAEFLGQERGEHHKEWFDQMLENKMLPQDTKRYLSLVRDLVYKTRAADPFYDTFDKMSVFASGILLGNPHTSTLNLLGGTTLNTVAHGGFNTLKAMAKLMVDWNNIKQEGRNLGILGKDMMFLLNDSFAQSTDVMEPSQRFEKGLGNMTGWLMKWGGYTGTEQIIRAASMVGAKYKLDDGLKAINNNPSGYRARMFKKYLTRHHLDWHKLVTEDGAGEETARYLRRMVNIPQGSYRIDMTPALVDHRMGRFMFKFQKFLTQVSKMYYDNYWLPMRKAESAGDRVKAVMSNVGFFSKMVLGGSAVIAARGLIFGTPDPGPDWEDLEEAFKDDDFYKKVNLAMSRAYHSAMGASAFGLFGNYIQMGLDITDQQRVKNPLDPPPLAPFKAIKGLAMTALEQGTLTKGDFDNFLNQFSSFYRGYKRAGLKGLESVGSEWKQVKLERARREVLYTRKIANRYAKETDLKTKTRMRGTEFGKSENSPLYAEVYDAIILGKPALARELISTATKGMNKEDADNLRRAVASSMRSRQPLKFGSTVNDDERRAFYAWAQDKNVSKANLQRIIAMDWEYRLAMRNAGLASSTGYKPVVQ